MPPGHGLRIVPDVDELLEHGQQADPQGHGAVSPAAEESGEAGGRKSFSGEGFGVSQGTTVRLDARNQIAGKGGGSRRSRTVSLSAERPVISPGNGRRS